MKYDDTLRLHVHPESYSYSSALDLMKDKGALMVLETGVFREKQDPRLFFYAAGSAFPKEKYDGRLNFRQHMPSGNNLYRFCCELDKYVKKLEREEFYWIDFDYSIENAFVPFKPGSLMSGDISHRRFRMVEWPLKFPAAINLVAWKRDRMLKVEVIEGQKFVEGVIGHSTGGVEQQNKLTEIKRSSFSDSEIAKFTGSDETNLVFDGSFSKGYNKLLIAEEPTKIEKDYDKPSSIPVFKIFEGSIGAELVNAILEFTDQNLHKHCFIGIKTSGGNPDFGSFLAKSLNRIKDRASIIIIDYVMSAGFLILDEFKGDRYISETAIGMIHVTRIDIEVAENEKDYSDSAIGQRKQLQLFNEQTRKKLFPRLTEDEIKRFNDCREVYFSHDRLKTIWPNLQIW